MDSNLSLVTYYRRRIITLKSKLDSIDPKSSDLQPLLDFQLYLIKQIIRGENRLKHRKDEMVVLKRALRDKSQGKVESKKLKELIKKKKDYIAGNKYILYLWRCFGDGLVFKYISKWNLKRFFYEADTPEIKQSSGAIGGKHGFEKELMLLVDAIKNNVPAILCDLTNVIRHGDLCLLGASDPFVIEVKSSKNRNDRVERQVKAIGKIHKYLEEDQGEIAGVDNLRRVELTEDDRHHGDIINKALELSKVQPYIRLYPEEGLCYVIVNTELINNCGDIFDGIEKSIVYMLNQEKTEQRWDNYYPFVLSIKDPVSLYRFIAGEIYILVIVNISTLQIMAKNIGYELELSEAENEAFIFSKSVNGLDDPFKSVVSKHFAGRIGLEFMTLEWFFINEKNMLIEMEGQLMGMLNDAS